MRMKAENTFIGEKRAVVSKKSKMTSRQRRKQAIIRQMVLLAVAVIILIVIIVAVVVMRKPKPTTEEGMKILQKMDQIEVAEIESKIMAIEKAEAEAAEAWANRTPNEKFANSLVMGDSITQGLYVYNVLDETYVQADRGAGVAKEGDYKSDKHMEKAEELQPQAVFLAYGLNDLLRDSGDENKFYEEYKVFITELKSKVPNARIYVNSVLPVQQFKIDQDASYASVPKYNEKLQVLCQEENLTFIDNTDLVKPEYYAQDGIHMAPEYYKGWVDRMAEVAEL